MADINLSLTTAEALAILDPIQDKALTASKLAATSEGDVHEIADLSALMLQRVATQLTDALYPEPVHPSSGFAMSES
jgi:predicted nucleotidyltransferase